MGVEVVALEVKSRDLGMEEWVAKDILPYVYAICSHIFFAEKPNVMHYW